MSTSRTIAGFGSRPFKGMGAILLVLFLVLMGLAASPDSTTRSMPMPILRVTIVPSVLCCTAKSNRRFASRLSARLPLAGATPSDCRPL